jgi:hypothetical protein
MKIGLYLIQNYYYMDFRRIVSEDFIEAEKGSQQNVELFFFCLLETIIGFEPTTSPETQERSAN